MNNAKSDDIRNDIFASRKTTFTVTTVFIHINAPRAMHFSKGGGGGATITYKKKSTLESSGNGR